MSIAIPAYAELIARGGQLLIVSAVLGGLWLALRRTYMEPGERIRIWVSIAAPLMLWLALAWQLSISGAFEARPGAYLTALLPAIALPIVIGLYLLMRSQRIAEILDATPPAWLAGVQFYRVLGAIFIALWADGLLPGEFARPAGIGDVLVGVLAVPLAFWLATGASASRHAAYAWNILGMADLGVAIATGFLSSPGPLQQLALDRPNQLISAYPLVLVPAFAVPLSIILHVLSIWQLNRRGQRAAEAGRALAATPFAHP